MKKRNKIHKFDKLPTFKLHSTKAMKLKASKAYQDKKCSAEKLKRQARTPQVSEQKI